MANKYYVNSLDVEGIWGKRDYSLRFYKDLNILIGRNGSGKTTLLNLLRFVLTADVFGLMQLGFRSTTVGLQSFDGASKKTVQVEPLPNGIRYQVSNRTYTIEYPVGRDNRLSIRPSRLRSFVQAQAREVHEILTDLVPAVWLPVSRRLPMPEEIDDDFDSYTRTRHKHSESVDQRLSDLLEELLRYRLRLDKQLSERYKQFERRVLQLTLYSPEQDTLRGLSKLSLPTNDEKKQLVRAFQEARLIDRQMSQRIDQHFEMAKEAIQRIQKGPPKDKALNLQDLFVIPLINRTRKMVEYASSLEAEREDLFSPLNKFERIVSDFFIDKNIVVEESGDLKVESTSDKGSTISPFHLSSGEKQTVILLTQALLAEDHPVVYVADEPELSLHVTWQAHLLSALQDLGGEIQIIVATHSPDIVGEFIDNVIDLDEKRV